MRIAQVCPFYYPRHGGVETVVKEYSERLVRRGHKVHVYTTEGNWRSPWFEDINGVKVHRSISIPLPVLKPLSPALLLPFKLWRADVDLIHIHANKYFSTDVGALVAKLKDTPLAYSPHAGTFGSSLFGKIHNQTIGRLALSADVVICVSEHEKSLIEASGVKVKRFDVLPNGVDTKCFLLEKRSPTKQGTSPMVLDVGRLSPHKGLDTLIKAAPLVLEKVPEAKFIIAGPRIRNWKLEIRSLKMKSKVTLTGEVSEKEKIALMQGASVFVLPSRSEAFGITVIEAMAAGCPVVVSDIPALTEVVENGQTGLVFPVNDEKSLASQIIKLLSDRELSHNLAENAKKVVKEKYDWEKIINRLEKIYTSLV
jgi:glycosyltransferase involved in cell wall biosynthesis